MVSLQLIGHRKNEQFAVLCDYSSSTFRTDLFANAFMTCNIELFCQTCMENNGVVIQGNDYILFEYIKICYAYSISPLQCFGVVVKKG